MRKTTCLLLFAMCAMFIGINPAFAEQREKVDICHYDKDSGYWELININGNAVNSHMAKHDDGAPGGYTSGTSTYLDETCADVLPSCGNCLVERLDETGCEEQNCEAAIVGIDPWCGNINWDFICVYEAQLYCVDVYCTD